MKRCEMSIASSNRANSGIKFEDMVIRENKWVENKTKLVLLSSKNYGVNNLIEMYKKHQDSVYNILPINLFSIKRDAIDNDGKSVEIKRHTIKEVNTDKGVMWSQSFGRVDKMSRVLNAYECWGVSDALEKWNYVTDCMYLNVQTNKEWVDHIKNINDTKSDLYLLDGVRVPSHHMELFPNMVTHKTNEKLWKRIELRIRVKEEFRHIYR